MIEDIYQIINRTLKKANKNPVINKFSYDAVTPDLSEEEAYEIKQSLEDEMENIEFIEDRHIMDDKRLLSFMIDGRIVFEINYEGTMDKQRLESEILDMEHKLNKLQEEYNEKFGDNDGESE